MTKLTQLMKRFKNETLLMPIWYENESIQLIDQKSLPFKEEIYQVKTVSELVQAIRDMTIRGSGAIGLCGAYGLYLASLQSSGEAQSIIEAGKLLKNTRPTAVNLMKTVDEIIDVLTDNREECLEKVENQVVEILERQLRFEHQLGEHGANLIDDGDVILTHCHSGALAGSGYGGRALSVIRKASEQGKDIRVITSETRPYLQGARITTYELQKFGIPYKLITDSMSGYCMSRGQINKVVVGSDRISRNGDLANKVGTYMHALAAKEHSIPFYTATSSHTIDFDTPNGEAINVEMRDSKEVTEFNGSQIAPDGTVAIYPSFDITPNHLIGGIITEKGVFSPSFMESEVYL